MFFTLFDKLEQLCEWLERVIFNDYIQTKSKKYEEMIEYFKLTFSQTYIFPIESFHALKTRIANDLYLNAALLFFFQIYLTVNHRYNWPFGALFTFWIIILDISNILYMLIRIILLSKLRQAEKAETYLLNFMLWILFQSKTYKIDTNIYQFVLVIPSIFFAIACLGKVDCPQILIIMPFAMLFLSGLYFFLFYPTPNFQNEVDLKQLFQSINLVHIHPMKIMKVKEYKTYPNYDYSCPICYEDYYDEDLVKQVECPGKHVFHIQCIDKWISKSQKCPMCNELMFRDNNNNYDYNGARIYQ